MNPNSVRALRRTGDGWETVPTTFVETTDGEYAYAVETTEFSEFAVVEGTQADSTPTATATPTPTATSTSTPTATPTPTVTSTTEPTTTSTTQPGFGVLVAVVALLGSAVLARRRS